MTFQTCRTLADLRGQRKLLRQKRCTALRHRMDEAVAALEVRITEISQQIAGIERAEVTRVLQAA